MQIMTTMSVKRQNMNSCNPEAVTRDKAGRHSDLKTSHCVPVFAVQKCAC